MQTSWKIKLQLLPSASVTVPAASFALAMAILSPAAHASSDAAWNKLKDDTRKACLAESGFRQARVLEGPVMFSHAVLYRIGGIWPQKHMHGKAGKMYCLHPFPDGKPEIAE